MARPASPYSPIVSQHGQTRVIELDPGAYDDTLNLRLRTVALPEYLDYEALSYVWGTHLCYQPAYVDGYETIITANLDVALRHFRRLHVSRTLWVDAISINQEDTEERGHQVQIMRDIYSSAREVLIWLGPLADQQQQDALAWVELDHIPASLGDRTTLIHGLRRLCQRPWFTRVWVIQEMALAKNEPIMHLGPRTVLWSHLVSYFQRVRNLQTKEYGLGAWPSSPDGRLTTFGSLYHNLYLPELRTMRNHYSLFTNAFNTRSLFSTDPRDMIFGLLGVSSNTNLRKTEPIIADYTKPVQQVFSEFMAKMILESYTYPYCNWPLHGLQPSDIDAAINVQYLPSWVPDFSMRLATDYDLETYHLPQDLGPNIVRLLDLLDEPNRLAPVAAFSSNFSILYTAGLHLGDIIATSAEYMPLPPSSAKNLWLSARTLYYFYTTYAKPRQIKPDLLFRTMLGRTLVDLPTMEEVQGKAAISRPISSATNHDEALAMGWYPVSRPALRRTVFITEEGQVGLAYHPDLFNGIRPGDSIVGLYGLNIPYILRKIPGGHIVINIAHVAGHEIGHDFFAGAAPGTSWRSFEDRGLREYTLL